MWACMARLKILESESTDDGHGRRQTQSSRMELSKCKLLCSISLFHSIWPANLLGGAAHNPGKSSSFGLLNSLSVISGTVCRQAQKCALLICCSSLYSIKFTIVMKGCRLLGERLIQGSGQEICKRSLEYLGTIKNQKTKSDTTFKTLQSHNYGQEQSKETELFKGQ